MARNNQRQNVGYGLSEALPIIFNPPIVAKRAPLTTDSAPIGTVWIWPATNTAWILVSIVANVATWSDITDIAGVFTSLTVTPGPISLTGTTTINTTGAAITTIGTGGTGAVNIGNATGNTSVTGSLGTTTTLTAGTGITSTTGNIVATAGQVNAGTTMTAGTGITATTGNIVASAGQVNAGTTMTAGTGITATTGDITASVGDIIASTGDITSTLGDITAGNNITATTGDISATAGDLTAPLGAVTAGTVVTGGTGVTATTGDITATSGNVVISAATNGLILPGPIDIITGAGAPGAPLALHAGDMYINTTPTGPNDRLWIATGVGTWTFIAANA